MKQSIPMRIGSIITGALMVSSAPVMAQKQVDVEISANLIDPQDNFTTEVVTAPDFGDVARPGQGECEYLLTGTSLGKNSIGEALCTTSDNFTQLKLNITCAEGLAFGFSGATSTDPSLPLFATVYLNLASGEQAPVCTGEPLTLPTFVGLIVRPNAELGANSITVPVEFAFE